MRKTFCIDQTDFRLAEYDDRLQVNSIHPYDETEYHWAYSTNGSTWRICRERRLVTTLGPSAPEQVAEKLLELDHAAGLTPRRAIW